MSVLPLVLGHDTIGASIAQTLQGGTDVSVIQGPPGVGKSWLANGIGALWEEGGGRTIIAQGDQLQSDAAYYALNLALAALGRRWSSVGKQLSQVTAAGEQMMGTAGVVTATVQLLSSLRPSLETARKLYLSEMEQGILFELDRLGRKRTLLIIADNLHWRDSRSPEFLGRLSERRMSEAFPFLANVRVIATQTIEPYQPTAHPTERDALLSRNGTRYYNLYRVSRSRNLSAAAGVRAIESELRSADYLACAGYKYLCCPYGLSFGVMTHSDKQPLVSNWRSRADPYASRSALRGRLRPDHQPDNQRKLADSGGDIRRSLELLEPFPADVRWYWRPLHLGPRPRSMEKRDVTPAGDAYWRGKRSSSNPQAFKLRRTPTVERSSSRN